MEAENSKRVPNSDVSGTRVSICFLPGDAAVSILHPLLGVACVWGVSFIPLSSTERGEEPSQQPSVCRVPGTPTELSANQASAMSRELLGVASSAGRCSRCKPSADGQQPSHPAVPPVGPGPPLSTASPATLRVLPGPGCGCLSTWLLA